MKLKNQIVIITIIALFNTSLSIADTKEQRDKYTLISARLGFSIEKILKDSLRYDKPDFGSRTQLFWQRTNFSSSNGKKEDYLLKVNFKADWWKNNTTLIIAFTKEANIYHAVFYWEGCNKTYNANPQLLDIDSDSKMEILIEDDYSGNQSDATQVDIWRYNGQQFKSIFSEGLDEGYTSCPYGTYNKYCFVKNQKNPKLLDIYFTVQTDTSTDNGSILGYFFTEQERLSWPKPVRDLYIFQFNGIEYVPNKPVCDYRKFFEQYFNEQERKIK